MLDARCSGVKLLLDLDNPGMAFESDRFCEQIVKMNEMESEK